MSHASHMNPDAGTTASHAHPPQGRCTLVGAGPGDPELLTLKAVRALARATLVLVDDLVHPDVLAHVQPSARVVHVGKRGGCASTPQAFIHQLMVTAVRQGEQVVRLKGGDPFIFGRGGEEIEHLRAQGIEADVVHGITSGLAAMGSLGTALTHREHAHGVLWVTGHAKPGDSGPDWALLGHTAHQAKLTLVIYMGVSRLAHICEGLGQGLPPHTPAAIVQHASLAHQRTALTTLGQLQATLHTHQLQSPSVVIVGDVVQGARAWAHSPHPAQATHAAPNPVSNARQSPPSRSRLPAHSKQQPQ